MALLKNKTLETGLAAEYWKITKIEIINTSLTNRTVITLDLFKDSDARTEGKIPAETTSFSFADLNNPCSASALETDSAYILCYNKLKTLPEFSGATDV